DATHAVRGCRGRQSRGRLVKQEQPGCADQRAADFDTAAIDHGQAANRLEQTVGQPRLEYLDQCPRGRVVLLELALEITASDQVEPQALIEALVVADHDVVEDGKRQRQTRTLECARHAGLIDYLSVP